MIFSTTFIACLVASSFVVKGTDAQLGFTPTPGKTYKSGFCNICGGDGYLTNPNHSLSNNRGWTCGYAQTTVQDVAAADSKTAYESERVHCVSTSLIAQQGGCQCRGGQSVQSSFTNLNDACHLCGAGNRVYNQNELTNTGVAGQHRCGSLSAYMLSGGVTNNLCSTIKANSYQDCCTMNVMDNQYSISYNSGGSSSSTPEYNTAKRTNSSGRNRERMSGLRGRGGAGSSF